LFAKFCLEIANSTALSDEGKFLRTFLDELHSFVPNFLPDSCEEYFQVDMVNLHPDYQGAGIGYRLVKEMLRLAKKLNLQYVVIGCTSSKIKRICEKVCKNNEELGISDLF
jgi:GNAT superfamily N-acetyltransferase